uniref:Topoisomerase 6 subunit A/Spo11 TOPRIM domain-containing protein n=1 Tax=Ananas comosus var. bracteatus TaxID=296719 RepID=A0A6V7NQI2_ANACO|nr:unnamed protein product [Ananas comosus var. bracteatus]
MYRYARVEFHRRLLVFWLILDVGASDCDETWLVGFGTSRGIHRALTCNFWSRLAGSKSCSSQLLRLLDLASWSLIELDRDTLHTRLGSAHECHSGVRLMLLRWCRSCQLDLLSTDQLEWIEPDSRNGAGTGVFTVPGTEPQVPAAAPFADLDRGKGCLIYRYSYRFVYRKNFFVYGGSVGVPGKRVRARIEVAVLNFLKALSSTTPAISNLPMISRRSDNCGLRSGRSLMRANDAKAFVRVWKVMQMCFLILGEGKLVNRTLQDVISLLHCTRQSLGVMASSRGAIIGRLVLQEPGEEGIDCSTLGPAGHAITGDLNLLSKVVFNSDARYIIIVEKRLAEDHLFNQIPCILITAKGYPDMATRNPAGLAILFTYKYGSITMGLESYRYEYVLSVHLSFSLHVKWLGIRGDDLHLIPEESLLELKPRDLQIAKSLLSSKMLQDAYKNELRLMVEVGRRAEIEALYCHGFDFLGKYIARKIVQSAYI